MRMLPVSKLFIFHPRILSDLKHEKIVFESCHTNLAGIISRPECDTNESILLLHPHPLYGGDMDNPVVTELERIFLELEYATLRFNFRGVSGRYAGAQGAVEDAGEALYFMDHFGLSVVGLAGYSFGGSIALRLASVKALRFTIALSASMNLFLEGGMDIIQLSRLQCPVLLFHGLSDTMVPHSDMKKFSNAIPEVKTVTLENENHFYSSCLPKVREEIRTFLASLLSGNEMKGILK
jgi:alpha/beta superfamily hydrolase